MKVTKRFQTVTSNVRDWLLIGLITILAAASIGGYVANIVKLAHSTLDSPGLVVLRAIGIFLGPLGAILGYL